MMSLIKPQRGRPTFSCTIFNVKTAAFDALNCGCFSHLAVDTETLTLQSEVTMVSSLIKSLPLIVVIMTAGVDGQQDWGVNYSPSYVCALKRSTVKISCTLTYPDGYEIKTTFWTKTVKESPDLCSDPEKRRGIQCNSEDKHTSSITLTAVTEADKHIYYCRFTTDKAEGKWMGIPGVQLDVTAETARIRERASERAQSDIDVGLGSGSG
ncbi:unnamed protein product [Leuciscus chuanchicus]